MNKQKIGAIIQARMGSTRFPGKVLKNIDNNETILNLLIKRLKFSKKINEIIIATTKHDMDSLIIKIAKKNNVHFTVGSELNVLKRYYKAVKLFSLDIIIRITSDCPFVEPKIIDDMINYYKNHDFDYIRNIDGKTNFPIGLDVEIFSFKTLDRVYNSTTSLIEKEHVTIYILNNPTIFSIYSYNDENYPYYYDLRLTIDYEEDLILLREIYKKIKENGKSIIFTFQDILNVIKEFPKLMNINKHHNNWRTFLK